MLFIPSTNWVCVWVYCFHVVRMSVCTFKFLLLNLLSNLSEVSLCLAVVA